MQQMSSLEDNVRLAQMVQAAPRASGESDVRKLCTAVISLTDQLKAARSATLTPDSNEEPLVVRLQRALDNRSSPHTVVVGAAALQELLVLFDKALGTPQKVTKP